MTLYPQFLLTFFTNINTTLKEILSTYNVNYPFILNIIMKLQPLLVLFILPSFIVLIFYVSLLIIYLYKLKDMVFNNIGNNPFTENSLRKILSIIWYAKSRILHGYEIVGLEKIPENESAYLVYFHGTIPLDIYYFATNYILKRNRTPVCVVDRFLFHLPGFRTLLDFMRCTPGSVDGCAKLLLESNEILLLSPGGVREALFSDQNYNILWGKRLGFAKIALLAKKPVYPMFTENIREPIRVVQLGKSFWVNLYEKTRIPLVFLYGYFPSKLRTYIGDPIYPSENEDAEAFAERVKEAIEKLIQEKQILPGNIVRSVLQRFPYFDNWFHSHNHIKKQPKTLEKKDK